VRELTQDTFHPRGNCWQFAVACILDVDPATMPAQFDHYAQNDPADHASLWHLSYGNALNAYLRKHHGLAYVEIFSPPEVFEQMRAVGYHMLTGRTVRSAAQNDGWHVVVAQDGEMVWDPHPSRAGLTEVMRWAFLTPFPKTWERGFESASCVCPRCREDTK
jgi:hypothetical protein